MLSEYRLQTFNTFKLYNIYIIFNDNMYYLLLKPIIYLSHVFLKHICFMSNLFRFYIKKKFMNISDKLQFAKLCVDFSRKFMILIIWYINTFVG